MDIVVGNLVISKAGRDKGKWLLVTSVDTDYAYVCDGDLRKIENAKKKKLIHLQRTNYVVDVNNSITNSEIRGILEQYKPL